MKWIKKIAETPLTTIAKVIDSLAATPNDRKNAPSIHAVREGLQDVASGMMYPVGSIYMSMLDVDPHELFGGTWNKIEGRYLLGSGRPPFWEETYAAGDTGGSSHYGGFETYSTSSHKLTLQEIPSHSHALPVTTLTAFSEGGALDDFAYFAAQGYQSAKGVYKDDSKRTLYSCGSNGAGTVTDFTPGETTGHSHSVTLTLNIPIMPPFIAVNMWVRVA